MTGGGDHLICIGAAKCATSWLHHYLGAMPEVAVSPLKEVHFFDAAFSENALGDADALALARLGYHLEQAGGDAETLRRRPTFRASLDRVQMIYDDSAYFAHFARCATPQTQLSCDITPAYSAIGAQGFAHMRDVCLRAGRHPKILFVMRDPVDRFWSQIRHLEQINPENRATERWQEALESPALRARADYAGIIAALDKVFPPGDLLCLFYETLFSGDALARLCAFIGLPARVGETALRLNETTLQREMPDAAWAAFHAALAPQYAFCRERFGEELPGEWQI